MKLFDIVVYLYNRKNNKRIKERKSMVFSSFTFILYFLPVFLFIYYLVPDVCRNIVIFLGSLMFYYYGVRNCPIYVALMLFAVLINYVAANRIEHSKSRIGERVCLILGLLYNFGCLFAFKYLDFVSENINRVLESFYTGISLPYVELILPIGISFYTFQISSYLVDVYRKEVPAERSILKLGTYLCMFPQLIAGPIVTYSQVREQMTKREYSFVNAEKGMREFTIGLASKVLIANRVGGLWTQIRTIGFESISTPLAWLGIFAYTFQIYFDFYGYSLMAKGLGRIMGFTFPDNFYYPYMATSMTEFWRRWHITLGSWFRDYVYIPLGGNRTHQLLNLFLVWMFTGLWHGASWNFVLWGLFCFLLVVIEKRGFGRILQKFPILGHLYMFLMIPLSWLLFAIEDLGQLWIYLGRLFPFLGQTESIVFAGDFIKYIRIYGLLLLVAGVCSTYLPKNIYRKTKYSFCMTLLLVIIFWACMYCIYQGMDDPFLYYQF